jgi:hypothetical protein
VKGILGRARLRRVVLLVGLAFAALPVGSALADTTVGQTGAPIDDAWVGGDELVATSYAVPAGGGTITSFQTQSASNCMFFGQGTYDFQVLRPQGGSQYLVLGDAGNQTDPCDGQVHSYSANIPVQAGDVLGVYVVSAWVAMLTVSGSELFGFQSEPTVGQTVTVASNFFGLTLDESATLVTQNDDSQGQSNNQGENQDN